MIRSSIYDVFNACAYSVVRSRQIGLQMSSYVVPLRNQFVCVFLSFFCSVVD